MVCHTCCGKTLNLMITEPLTHETEERVAAPVLFCLGFGLGSIEVCAWMLCSLLSACLLLVACLDLGFLDLFCGGSGIQLCPLMSHRIHICPDDASASL